MYLFHNVVRSIVASTRALVHAPWSASKIQMALRCPREFYYCYVDKVAKTDQSPEARIGKAIHTVLEHALLGNDYLTLAAQKRALLDNPAQQARFDALMPGVPAFLERIRTFRQRRRVTRQLVEFTGAMRENLTATAFHAPDALYRGIFDVGYLFDSRKLAVIDHKSGERRPSLSFTDQLEGYAVLAAALFRGLRSYFLGVYWVADQTMDWSPPWTAQQVQTELAPRVLANIEAAALAVDDGPRPTPSEWCLLCSYRSTCPTAHDLLLERVDQEDVPDWVE